MTLSKFQGAFVIAVALAITACTDYRSEWRDDNPAFWGGNPTADNEENSSSSQGVSIDTVATEDDLSNCTSKKEGLAIFIKDIDEVWVCTDRSWEPMSEEKSSSSKVESVPTEDDLPSCTKSREKLVYFVEDEDENFVCTDGMWVAESSGKTESSSSDEDDESSSSEKPEKRSSSSKASGKCTSTTKVTTTYLNRNVDYGTFVDERDCQEYRTVEIGDQVWMAQNLNYDTEDDESSCANGNCEKYGRFYTGMGAPGACPDGWRLPSESDFNLLMEEADSEGTNMMSSYSSYWNGMGSDELGFSAIPVGYIYEGEIDEFDISANFWADAFSGETGKYMYIYQGVGVAMDDVYDLSWSRSIRCIQDNEI